MAVPGSREHHLACPREDNILISVVEGRRVENLNYLCLVEDLQLVDPVSLLNPELVLSVGNQIQDESKR